MAKKILLGIGSIAAISTPAMAIISCGADTGYSSTDQSIIDKINSTEATKSIEAIWLSKVLKDIYEDDKLDVTADFSTITTPNFKEDFKKAFEFFMINNLKTNPTYYKTLLDQIKTFGGSDQDFVGAAMGSPTDLLLNNQIFELDQTSADEEIAKFNKDITINGKTKTPMEFFFFDKYEAPNGKIFNPISTGLKSQILRMLIVKKYSTLTRSEWQAVNQSSYTSDSQILKNTTKDTTVNYPLVREALTKKMAVSWTETLTKTDSTAFFDPVAKDEHTWADTVAKVDLAATDGFATDAKRSDKHAIVFSQTNVFSDKDAIADSMFGYKGIIELPTGSDALDFSESGLKSWYISGETDLNKRRTGFLVDKKIINDKSVNKDKVAWFAKDAQNVDVHYIRPLMPKWIGKVGTGASAVEHNQLEFDANVNLDVLAWTIFNTDPSLYTAAINYYTKRERNPLFAEIKNDNIFKLLQDKGMTFIKNV